MLFQSVLLSCAAALVIAAPTNLTLSDIEVRADKVVTFRSMSGDVLELINGRWAGPIKDSQSIYWRAMPNSDGKFDHPFKVWLKDGSKPICHLTGKLNKDTTSYAVTEGDDYVKPCGSQDGVNLVCGGPKPFCG